MMSVVRLLEALAGALSSEPNKRAARAALAVIRLMLSSIRVDHAEYLRVFARAKPHDLSVALSP